MYHIFFLDLNDPAIVNNMITHLRVQHWHLSKLSENVKFVTLIVERRLSITYHQCSRILYGHSML